MSIADRIEVWAFLGVLAHSKTSPALDHLLCFGHFGGVSAGPSSFSLPCLLLPALLHNKTACPLDPRPIQLLKAALWPHTGNPVSKCDRVGGLAASAQLLVRGMYLRSLCVYACVCRGGEHIHTPEPMRLFFGYRVLPVLEAATILERFPRRLFL